MGEIGQGTGSSYPVAIDTNATPEVNYPDVGATIVRKETPNDLAACVIAIETTLGTNPQGSGPANVKSFLQLEHNPNGTHRAAAVITPGGAQAITGNKVVQGAFQGVPTLRGASNLKCAVASDTTFTITADYFIGAKPASFYNTYFKFISGTTYTVDVTTVGANGSDVGTFVPSSWIHVYLIVKSSDGTTAGLASAVGPLTGPTLPVVTPAYDMWYYCGAFYFDASSHLVPARIRGNAVYYDTQQNAVNDGNLDVVTPVDLAALVPPNASSVLLNLRARAAGSPSQKVFTIQHVSGLDYYAFDMGGVLRASSQCLVPLTTAQTVYYIIDNNANQTYLSIWVAGFMVSNGAS